MNCAEASATVQSYVDGELDGVDRESMERHLVACPTCSGRVRLQTRFRAAVRAHLHRPEVPFALRRRVEEALKTQPIAPLRWPAWMSLPRMPWRSRASLSLLSARCAFPDRPILHHCMDRRDVWP